MTESTVFFGSGPVAAASLEKLLKHTPVEAVITKPRPAHHRGPVPVIDVATRHNLPVHTVSTKRELDVLLTQTSFTSRYGILIDFGIIISQAEIDHFPMGIINSHFSLLPHLRGADPITFAILEGATKTGVSLMCVDEGMDTGKLITYRTHHLTGHETTPELTASLIDLSDDLLREFVPRYLSGDVVPRQQPHPDRATYSRKLTKADGDVDWTLPAVQIERQIRAFIDWPQSRAMIGRLPVVITAAQVIEETGEPGHFTATKTELYVATGDQSLSIDRLKPIGKKEMPIQAFLAGYRDKL